jgi:hypothetical protein
MNRDRIKIAWKFDRQAARRKFGYKRNSFTRSKTYVPNTASVAIAPGGILVAYGTGAGVSQADLASGAACTGGTFASASATLGGVPAVVNYAGCAPGYVGLDQYNIVVPSTLPDGCFLPLQVTIGSTVSNVVSVAVSKTGNCNSATSGFPNLGTLSSYGVFFPARTGRREPNQRVLWPV